LKQYRSKSISYYANIVKSFRRFFRDFLQRPELVTSFKLPKSGFVPKVFPSKEELQRFYKHLDNTRDKVLFLMFASTGLRKCELLSITLNDINQDKRMIIPSCHNDSNGTKRSWVSFYNHETEKHLNQYLNEKPNRESALFGLSIQTSLRARARTVSKQTGVKIIASSFSKLVLF